MWGLIRRPLEADPATTLAASVFLALAMILLFCLLHPSRKDELAREDEFAQDYDTARQFFGEVS